MICGHLSKIRSVAAGWWLYGREGDDDGRDCGVGDTRSFKIELKNRSFCRVKLNIRSDSTYGYEDIFILLMAGGPSHQSKKNVGWRQLK
jgi:hypothetical protein